MISQGRCAVTQHDDGTVFPGRHVVNQWPREYIIGQVTAFFVQQGLADYGQGITEDVTVCQLPQGFNAG